MSTDQQSARARAAYVALAVFLTFGATAMSGSSTTAVAQTLGSASWKQHLGWARTLAQLFGLSAGLVIAQLLASFGCRSVLLGVIFVVGLGQTCIACAASGFVGSSTTLRVFLLGSVLNGVSLHALTCAKELLARSFSAKELPREYGKLSMYSALAYVAGPVVFIALHDGVGVSSHDMYWVALAPLSAAACIATTLRGASAPRAQGAAAGGSSSVGGCATVAAMVIAVLVAFPFSTMMQSLDMYLDTRFGLAPGAIAGTTVVIAVSYAVSQAVVFPRAHARLGSVCTLMCAGSVVAAIGATVDSFASFPLWLGAMSGCVAAMAVAVSASDVLLVELAVPDTAAGNARASTVASINSCVSPSLAGAILDAKLPLFRVSAAVCAVGVVLGSLAMPARAAPARVPRGSASPSSFTPRRSARLSSAKKQRGSVESGRKAD
jgi:hypothetical protein